MAIFESVVKASIEGEIMGSIREEQVEQFVG